MVLLVAIYLVIVYAIPRPKRPDQAGGLAAAGDFSRDHRRVDHAADSGGRAGADRGHVELTAIGGLTIEQALGGYADKAVWLVMAACFISRALLNAGLARRIALFFVRMFGKSSLGVSYALGLSDMVLATVIPSNAARSGGVILPVARSIAELYGSTPGATANLLGSFLMTSVYQSICVTSAIFYTAQASNPVAARIAGSFGYQVTWLGWMMAGIVPGAVSLAGDSAGGD